MRFLVLVAILSTGLQAHGGSAKAFRAGAATSNVTPWLGVSINGGMHDHKATNVHDELHARCLVLDDSSTRLAVAVVDSCMVPRKVIDEAKRLASERTGIPVSNMLVSATHTHSAPAATGIFQSEPEPEYQKFLARRVADGIWRAANNLAPARIGWGSVRVPEHVFNRRWFMKALDGQPLRNPFGQTNDQVKMNPPAGSAELLDLAGPVDPEVVFISVQHTNDRPLALLANYSLHYCGGVGQGIISADYFGVFAERIQQLFGADRQDPPFVGIMANGTSGDINNINFRRPAVRQPLFSQMRLVGNAVAEAVHRAHATIKHRDWVPLRVASTELSFGARKPSAKDLERAQTILTNAGTDSRTVEQIYARETVLMNDYPAQVPLLLQAFGIGDVGIAAIPCEVFVQIGLEFKKESPFKHTFTISLANGYNGYLPTVEHHKLGGYETWRARSSYLETNAAPRIVQTILGLLKEVQSSP